MGTSLVPSVIDALVAAFKASATLGQATPPVAIYDGPELTKASSKLHLWVGIDDPDGQGLASSAESNQSFPGLGTRQRDELGLIYCAAEAWSGSTAVKSGRDSAYAIVHAIETILRTDATLAGALTTVAGWGEIDAIQLRQGQAEQGFVARVSFTIKYKARI